MNKLVLGTVQFGIKYGINSKRKNKIPIEEVFEILDYSVKNNINTFDTAYNYSESEKVIGTYIKERQINLNIISKLPKTNLINSKKYFLSSLKKLRIKSFYGYLFHDFETFIKNKKILDVLCQLKKDGLVNKIGFSLYFPQELEYLLKNKINFDIVQIPYNIFDQRFTPFFKQLKEKNIEIHARSIYLQGLVFKNINLFTDKFFPLRNKLKMLQDISNQIKVPYSAIFLNFVVNNKYIDKVIIGIGSKKTLKANINHLKYNKSIKNLNHQLIALKENNEDIILPINW